MLGNDAGLEDVPVPVTLVSGPTYAADGGFTLNDDGTFIYVHDGSENFTDSFTYRVTDNGSEISDRHRHHHDHARQRQRPGGRRRASRSLKAARPPKPIWMRARRCWMTIQTSTCPTTR